MGECDPGAPLTDQATSDRYPDYPHASFAYKLKVQILSTVYVLVDNRDLTNLDNPDPSLQHWPAVAAWWSSRACMQGPAQELCDVVFFPVSQASGLHLVHHTWAGTFVLAALCLVFPGLHIVLLDSDCVPVTLFEVEDLWQEAQRLQHCGFPGPMQKSMRDLLSYGAPIMLHRFLRKTGREYHFAQANPKSLLFKSTGRSWWMNTGSWSPQWFQMGEMTGT